MAGSRWIGKAFLAACMCSSPTAADQLPTSEITVGEFLKGVANDIALEESLNARVLVKPYFAASAGGQIELPETSHNAISRMSLRELLANWFQVAFDANGYAKPADTESTLSEILLYLEYVHRFPKVDVGEDSVYVPLAQNFAVLGDSAFGFPSVVIFRFKPTRVVDLSDAATEITVLEDFPHELKFSFSALAHTEVITSALTQDDLSAYEEMLVGLHPNANWRGDNERVSGANGDLRCNSYEQPVGAGRGIKHLWTCNFRIYPKER